MQHLRGNRMLINLDKESALIGVISDTHGLYRPEISEIFNGVDYIIHAGDVGGIWVLDKLKEIAPVLAIKGNTDKLSSIPGLSVDAILKTASSSIYLLHNIADLDLDSQAAGFNAVIYGHSHLPSIEFHKDILFFNPGSAGPRRFRLPISVGLLRVDGSKLKPEIIELTETRT
jgi:putative phosphoesterase